jgi:hypothetical protein
MERESEGTHVGRFVAAFDNKGQRIRPVDYSTMLRGAVAAIHFGIHKVTVGTEAHRNDRFMADIIMIRVLIPPWPCSPWPKQ